jgi:hypothetical protein
MSASIVSMKEWARRRAPDETDTEDPKALLTEWFYWRDATPIRAHKLSITREQLDRILTVAAACPTSPTSLDRVTGVEAAIVHVQERLDGIQA